MSEVALIVEGRKYLGWTSIRITRTVETLAGSFDLEVYDRWSGQDEPWPIVEEDECQVAIDGEIVIDGYVNRRTLSYDATSRTLAYGGRDKAAALMENSALLTRWSFRHITIQDLAKKLCEPFGVKVSVQEGLQLPKLREKIVVSPGESPYDILVAAARDAEVLVVSDGRGGIIITRAGTQRAMPLIEGQNILGASVSYTGEERFRRYIVITQSPGKDTAAGHVTRVRAEAIDEGVRREERVLVVRPEVGATADYARRRGDWEARIRAARAQTVSVTVQGWRQADGTLWPLNALVQIKAPSVGVDGEMRISQATHSLGAAGAITELRLVRPDAFTPEPRAVVRKSGERWWANL